MEDNNQRPKVGLGVIVFKEGKVLLGKRKNAAGDGLFATPGGHLEYMESFEDCVKRETMEEAGIEIENVRFLAVKNIKNYAPKHYVDVHLMADWKSGEPQNLEPERCEGWDWYDLDNLPQPLFGAMASYIENLKSGNNYFDA